ncbi:hypothetical protein C1645_779872 [Glomus cerebriforme]|uniref:Reelin domain-containing protein n=1 Tax=Glomus cerebriforme TaxID=658196 RepID=A0A397SU03_9GLOM|nr:hypothetical protein C1645_779872 [Glomus cerebriforme]
MKRIMIFAFALLATLSIVNAATFKSCPADPFPPMNLLTVTISPDPLVPGEYSTFEVSGELSKPTSNADLFIGFSDTNSKLAFCFGCMYDKWLSSNLPK